jgi:formamidopyrimidine-DNA glycosylase
MPELPEIFCRAREMSEHLKGRTIASIEVKQPKCLNVSVDAFVSALRGAQIGATRYHGKWLITQTSRGNLLINLGMGGELLLVEQDGLPEKWRVRFDFEDSQAFCVNFWWFGNVHHVEPGRLGGHAMTAKLGPNALDVTASEFSELLAGRRGRIKAFLLDQSKIAGIGNAYVHDILFRAKLHPLRAIQTLSTSDVDQLHAGIHEEFQRSIAKGAAQYELDLLGKRGGFGAADLLVGYREGESCPECGTRIEKLKTGSTTSYLCPQCQPLPE